MKGKPRGCCSLRPKALLAPGERIYGVAVSLERNPAAEALALVEATDERHWEAERYRVQAELLLMQGDEAGGEASFQQAIAVARRQQAKSWELRAATGLARLWQTQGRVGEARQMLAPVYGWFTEGFATRDLQGAKALLDNLA